MILIFLVLLQSDRSVCIVTAVAKTHSASQRTDSLPEDPDQGPPQDTRDKIIEVAEVQFASGGYAGVGMRQLAAAVGLSKSALFHHFPTKLDLYEEVLSRVLERLEDGLEASRARSDDPADRLDAWIDSVVRSLSEDMPAARLLMRALVEEHPHSGFQIEPGVERELMPSEVRLARILTRYRVLVEEGIAAGVFRPMSVPDALQTTIGALVFHFASGALGDALIGESIFSPPAIARRRKEVAEFIRRGFLA